MTTLESVHDMNARWRKLMSGGKYQGDFDPNILPDIPSHYCWRYAGDGGIPIHIMEIAEQVSQGRYYRLRDPNGVAEDDIGDPRDNYFARLGKILTLVFENEDDLLLFKLALDS